MPTAPINYPTVLRHALRRARRTQGLKASDLATRMAALGHPWHPQTVSNVESGRRRVPAEELLALALALESSISDFLTPFGGQTPTPDVALPDGGLLPHSVAAALVGSGRYEKWLHWDPENQPIWPDQGLVTRRHELEAALTVAEARMEELLYEHTKAQRDAPESPRSRALGDKQRAANDHWLDLREQLELLKQDVAHRAVRTEDEEADQA